MLKISLYSIVAIAHKEPNIVAEFILNKEDDIFKGHFPDQPVLPGACMLQILKEVLETALNKKIRLKKADQLKFLALIDPTVINTLKLDISYVLAEDGLKVNAIMSSENGPCFKFKGDMVIL
jgi:3-hydroxyacyl-[acyl-carrier-protein] dehydratase